MIAEIMRGCKSKGAQTGLGWSDELANELRSPMYLRLGNNGPPAVCRGEARICMADWAGSCGVMEFEPCLKGSLSDPTHQYMVLLVI